MLTYDKMIPLSVDIANKVLRLVIVLKHKKEKSALLIEVSVPNDFGLNVSNIRKKTKYQNLKSGPAINGSAGTDERNKNKHRRNGK